MKHLRQSTFTLLVVFLFTATSAQTTGAFLKFDLDGKTISFKSDKLSCYNSFESGDDGEKPNNEHVFYVSTKQTYNMDIKIHTPPHTKPVVGKLPYVHTLYNMDSPSPAVEITLTKVNGEEYIFFGSHEGNSGYCEITKVAAGWVEGKFELDMPRKYEHDNDEVLHITNGYFRFKIQEEMKD